MKTRIIFTAAILTFLLLTLSLPSFAGPIQPIVEWRAGRVEVQKAGDSSWQMVSTSRILDKGGSGKTLEKSVARLHLGSPSSFALMEEKCQVRYEDLVQQGKKFIAAFRQDGGKMWIKIDNRKPDRPEFQVKTPQALLAVQGTAFYVRVGRGDPSKGPPPEVIADYIKDDDKKDEGGRPDEIRDEVPPGGMIPKAGIILGGGASIELLAQAEPQGQLGFTKVGILEGAVLVKSDHGGTFSATKGQTVVIWDGQDPMLLAPDPYLVKKSNIPTTIANEIPEFPESAGASPDPGVMLNPSAVPSGGFHPEGSSPPPCTGPCY